MKLWSFLLLTVMKACSGPVTGGLEGAWQSNRDLTLAELRQAQSFTSDQWRALSDPTLFGHMVHVYRGNRFVTVFEGECSSVMPFQVVSADSGSVAIRYVDPDSNGEQTLKLVVAPDRLYVPIAILKGRARETFTRVSLEEVVRQHPCVRALLEE